MRSRVSAGARHNLSRLGQSSTPTSEPALTVSRKASWIWSTNRIISNLTRLGYGFDYRLRAPSIHLRRLAAGGGKVGTSEQSAILSETISDLDHLLIAASPPSAGSSGIER